LPAISIFLRARITMAIQHIPANAVVRLRPGNDNANADLGTSHAIAKGEHLELIRIVLRQGESKPRHAVDAEMTVQCLAGALRLRLTPAESSMETEVTLSEGDLLLLAAGTGYELHAEGDAVGLLTIALPFAGSASMSSPGYR
jgi:quercetin dioxygenase-like cupin family protein